jgi:hypothetical protein
MTELKSNTRMPSNGAEADDDDPRDSPICPGTLRSRRGEDACRCAHYLDFIVRSALLGVAPAIARLQQLKEYRALIVPLLGREFFSPRSHPSSSTIQSVDSLSCNETGCQDYPLPPSILRSIERG